MWRVRVRDQTDLLRSIGRALLYLGGGARNLYFGKCGVATLLGLTLVTCDEFLAGSIVWFWRAG